MSGKQDRQSAVEVAYRSLRKGILSGALDAGERLTEAAIAKRLEISRTPVREAISRLISEGFVERGEGYSTRVVNFALDEVMLVFDIRARIESYAVREATINARPDEIGLLRSLSDQMTALTPPRKEAEFETLSDLNEEFHRTLYGLTRSPRLQVIMGAVVDVGIVARTYRSYSDRAMIRSANHHAELVDAIEAGQPDWAESVMRSHVLAAKASLVALKPEDKEIK
ncbi:GntR family transcriptional regulator [Sulfitobacter geojensis]|uniref:GntR family transcriptional regulator n=1 Tax=Sulfitobacter geojensis TaxID=1342299 RepID=UPI00046A50D5|nr:GntR family transcriptional regulator [Sulfitobacter geojensis]KHA51325.1 Transcriptional regulater [Sulfitobacter geojensis]NYI30268.1 DNA-binding GntR family transcriptional regulator [Sulfitobacter geojensis]